MKRFVCAVVAGLVSMGGWTSLLKAAEPKPYSVLAWDLADLNKDKPIMVSPYRNIVMMYRMTTADLENPARVKELLDRQPEGLRAIRDWDVWRKCYSHPDDQLVTASGEKFTGPWWDNGVADAEAAYDKFFREYKALGGKLDYFILDTEHTITKAIKKPEHWAAVEQDPRFVDWVKPLGIKEAKEVYSVHRPFSWWNYNNYLTSRHYDRLCQVVAKYFPDVKSSDYGVGYDQALYKDGKRPVAWGFYEDTDFDYPGRYGFHVGTHQSYGGYGVLTYVMNEQWEGRKFGSGPFRSLMMTTNYLRGRILSSDVPLMPWLAWRGYVSDFTKKKDPPPYCSYGKTDYFQESVFHMAMLDPEILLAWSARRWDAKQKYEDWTTDEDLELIDAMVGQINELVGYSDRQRLVGELSDWYAPFLLSGAIANDQSVWRLTPDPEQSEVTLDQIKVNDDPLTFKVGNYTIVMKGAKVHEPEKPLSSVGYWIVGPKDLKPQITRD